MLRPLSVAAAFAVAACVFAPAPAQNAKEPDTVRIGMTQSIFVDIPPVLVQMFAPSFGELTRECSGLTGQMVVGGDAFELSQRLRAKEVDFAVYQGVEFAWASQKHGDLVPLMVAINRHRFIKAYLVVRKDSTATGFADIKGKDIAFPLKSKEHCRLFLERNCTDCGHCEPKAFFGHVTRPGSTETALDKVCSGDLAAAIVENAALENYQTIKPGCAAKLRVAKTSETFPVAAIVYRKGAINPEVLTKFKEGMLNANKNDRSRELMNVFQVTAFEPVPGDYAQTCADILRAYPPPEPTKVSQR
jgi:ABC-type phosphate/phosphonate transport system substrate-binding protein